MTIRPLSSAFFDELIRALSRPIQGNTLTLSVATSLPLTLQKRLYWHRQTGLQTEAQLRFMFLPPHPQ